MKIENVNIYGLKESIVASGYPMSIIQSIDMEKASIEEGLKRVKHLGHAKGSSGHDCFLKGIVVQADVTAPQYFWLQFGRYHFADIISSQSKMHRITEMNIEDNCNKWVDNRVIGILDEKIQAYKKDKTKDNFQAIISNTPSGYMLTARITTNYLQLKTMHEQRKAHKLEEWSKVFTPWIETLPYFKELVL